MTMANGTNGAVHQGGNFDAPRFEGVVRPYTDADVAKLQGSLKIEHTLAKEGAKKLWVRSGPLYLAVVMFALPSVCQQNGHAPHPRMVRLENACMADDALKRVVPALAVAAAQRAVRALPGRHDRQPGHAAGTTLFYPTNRLC